MTETLMTVDEQTALLRERDSLRREVHELTEKFEEAGQLFAMLVTVVSSSIQIYKITKSPEILDMLTEKSQDFLNAINAQKQERA